MPRRSDHIHRYVRVKLGKDKNYYVWRCTVDGCPHYLARELIVGRQSICWRCGRIFTITQAVLELKKPHCVDCTKGRTGVEVSADIDLDALLKDLQ